MNKDEILDVRDLEQFLWQRLLDLGYVPESDEVETLTDIFMEYLIYFGMVEEMECEDFDS